MERFGWLAPLILILGISGYVSFCVRSGGADAAATQAVSTMAEAVSPAPVEGLAAESDVWSLTFTAEYRRVDTVAEPGGDPRLESDPSGLFRVSLAGSGRATIDWGDGSEPERVSLERFLGYGRSCTAQHAYQLPGSYPVRISGTEGGELSGFRGDQAWKRADMYLTGLDVSHCPDLEQLHCAYNRLRVLDVSRNAKLQELYCGENDLTELDLSRNAELQGLGCSGNRLTELDLAAAECEGLRWLDCSANRLAMLDVRGCPNLKYLECSKNRLTTLRIAPSEWLNDLYCGWNRLERLELPESVREYILTLACQNNRLTELDLTGCGRLILLNCSDNDLTALEVAECPELRQLYGSGNRFSVEEVDRLYGGLPHRAVGKPGGVRLDENDGAVGDTSILASKNWRLGALWTEAEVGDVVEEWREAAE